MADNPQGRRPAMADIGAKQPTRRVAEARAQVWLPDEIFALIRDDEIITPKGAVFQTATLAGIIGAKHCPHLIPLCHPLPIETCDLSISPIAGNRVEIRCRVATHYKTGVEMESLTGAATAALTIYDMCKRYSQEMRIETIELISKQGGRTDYTTEATP